VDPPLRIVRAPDTTATAPVRRTTTAPPPAASTAPAPASTPASPAPSGTGTSSPPGGGDYLVKPVPPEPITRVPPVYPESARQARVGGVVLVRALVDTEGRVRATRIARSIPELDSAAVQCVRQWRFKPGTSGGVAIATWAEVPVRFLLQ
jgi:protein TonB